MNAYYQKTFVVNSAFGIDIKYYGYDNAPLRFDPKYCVVDMVFTNLENGKKMVLENIGTVRENHVEILAYASVWDKAPKGFFKDDITDIYGYGSFWHSYAIWLKPLVGEDRLCVMRGKARLVRAGY